MASLSSATLAGHLVTSARATLPAWGCWYAEVAVDGEVPLAGRVELVIADLKLQGTILSGGPEKGRSSYRVVAGAGGWGKTIKATSDTNDAGVKLATVLGAAAREVGETLAPIDPSQRVGPGWTRPRGPAHLLLDSLAPRAWYIDEAGTTRLGARPKTELVAKAARITPVDLARGVVELAAEQIATLVPGVVVDGLQAVDVEHAVSAEGGLRTKVWGARGGPSSRFHEAIAALLPDLRFVGVSEYRIVTQEGKRLNLQPVRVSTGMPDLRRVVVRPGVPGCEATYTPGARVLVGFVDRDPARAYVAGFADAEDEGFVPIMLTIAKGTFPAARMGDAVVAGPFGGTVTTGSTKVRVG